MRCALFLFYGLTFSLCFDAHAAAESTSEVGNQRHKRASPASRAMAEGVLKRQRAATECIQLFKHNVSGDVIYQEEVNLLAHDQLWGQSLREHIDATVDQQQWVIAAVPVMESEMVIHTNGRRLYAYINKEKIRDQLPFQRNRFLNINEAAYYLIVPEDGSFRSRYIGRHAQVYNDTPEDALLRLLLDGRQNADQFCALSNYYYELGIFAESIFWSGLAREMLKRNGETYHDVLNDLATVYAASGSLALAQRTLEKARKKAEQGCEPHGYILANQATVHWRRGDVAAAMNSYKIAQDTLLAEGQSIDWLEQDCAAIQTEIGRRMQDLGSKVEAGDKRVDTLTDLLYLYAHKGEDAQIITDMQLVDIATTFLEHHVREQMIGYRVHDPDRYVIAEKQARILVKETL